MEKDIDTLKSSFQVSYETYASSRERAEQMQRLYHNEQYTYRQLQVLRKRGAPAETFNVIKLFTRVLIGYYSTVVNTIQAMPKHPRDAQVAAIANDAIDHTFRTSQFETEGDDCKQDLLLSGLCCAKETVYDTGERDEFGRPVMQVKLSHVPAHEIVLDYMSTEADYSDARYLHRYKWITDEVLKPLLKGTKYKIEDFDNEHNHLQTPESEFRRHGTANDMQGSSGGHSFSGHYKEYNHFLLVETVVETDDGKRWKILWIDDIIISETEITHKEVRFGYRVQRLYQVEDARYYGIFEDIVESQHAINQALVKLQQAVNTQKVFYEKSAVEDKTKFRNQVNRINAIIEVKDLTGIRVENLGAEAREQYEVIDRSLTRIKMVLGVTDSFLGMAFASDSGRKVKLQQNATAMAMRHLTVRIEQFYRLLGWDILNLVKQYYYANRMLLLTDNLTGQRWVELNKPLKKVVGVDPQSGQPIEEPVYEEVFDPETGKPMVDDDGNIVIAPVPDQDTALTFTNMDISLDSVSYSDEDEKAQLLMEQVLSGPMGQSLQSVDPAAYMKVVSLVMKVTKTRYSGQMADIFEEVALKLNQVQPGLGDEAQAQAQAQAQQNLGFGQSPKSKALKLPQNTNEGVE